MENPICTKYPSWIILFRTARWIDVPAKIVDSLMIPKMSTLKRETESREEKACSGVDVFRANLSKTLLPIDQGIITDHKKDMEK